MSKCKFCDLSFEDIEDHEYNHVTDFNTPAAVLKDSIYILNPITDYSSFTTKGHLAMLLKFLCIQLPNSDAFETKDEYDTFVNNHDKMLEMYLCAMFDQSLVYESTKKSEYVSDLFNPEYKILMNNFVNTLSKFIDPEFIKHIKGLLHLLDEHITKIMGTKEKRKR